MEEIWQRLEMASKNSPTEKDRVCERLVISSPADFRAKGINIAAWAKERGFNANLVYAIIKGHRKSLRGQSFQIATEIGLKRKD